MGRHHSKLLKNLERMRIQAGLTQQELSESAEVSRKSINAIEMVCMFRQLFCR